MISFRYLAKRLMITALLVYLVTSFIFLIFRLMPGTYVDVIASGVSDPKIIAQLEEKYGVYEPIHVQYAKYMTNMLTGDAGTSFAYGDPVIDVVTVRIINSFILIAPAILTGFLIGSLLGTYMANHRGQRNEKGVFTFATLCGTIPEFFTSMLLVIVFASWLGWFPTSGMASLDVRTATNGHLELMQTSNFWWHYSLPFAAIALRNVYSPSLIMRTSVVETRRKEFLHYIRMKGLSPRRQTKHLMKHASLPVITSFPSDMTKAIGGMVLVEVVFNWPGIGNLLVESILLRDYPVVQFVFLIAAVWVILGNLVVDVLYSIIDPRIAVSEGER